MKYAKVIIDKDFEIAKTDLKLFSSFVEPLGRCVYGGLYDPEQASADEDGFRQDIMKYITPLKLTMNRFPGGNFVSTYRWEDGIGPKESRPRRAEAAWQSIETNQFGLDEFARWSRKNHSDVMMTVNLATRGVLEAMDCVEYCNFKGGTYWSDLRIKNGFPEPLGYKYWCLSNEVDGLWQVGQKKPYEYGLLAKEAAKGMKLIDPEIRTVLAGTSVRGSATFPYYDVTALNEAYDFVDYLSIHHYIGNAKNDSPSYLAKPLSTNSYFEEAAAAIKYVKTKLHSDHDVFISFDEFNTWHNVANEERFDRRWRIAPPLLEDRYTSEDALALGGMLLAVLRHADVVKIACLSELVNCISHLRTSDTGAWALPAYYAFLDYSRYGRGTVLETKTISDRYDCADFRSVPYLDAQAVVQDSGDITIFAINRSLEEELAFEMELRGFDADYEVSHHFVLTADDPKATNTEENPNNVVPQDNGNAAAEKGRVRAALRKMSWNVILLHRQTS